MFHNVPMTGACSPGRVTMFRERPPAPKPEPRQPRSWTGDLMRFDFGRAVDLEQVALPAYLLAGPLIIPGRNLVPVTTSLIAARTVSRGR